MKKRFIGFHNFLEIAKNFSIHRFLWLGSIDELLQLDSTRSCSIMKCKFVDITSKVAQSITQGKQTVYLIKQNQGHFL